MITGLDLIQEQVRAAQGEVLRWKQEDITIKVQGRADVLPCLRDLAKGLLGITSGLWAIMQPYYCSRVIHARQTPLPVVSPAP
jgi:biotin carboxylase